jgi:hypothetical protein
VGSSFLVVDTGPWIFGRKVMIPAGAIEMIDDKRKVFVRLTKEQIRNSPAYDESLHNDEKYRTDLGIYYGPMI